jgi:hypothetical protein
MVTSDSATDLDSFVMRANLEHPFVLHTNTAGSFGLGGSQYNEPIEYVGAVNNQSVAFSRQYSEPHIDYS